MVIDMDEKILIEIHILYPNKKTLLDIDCNVGLDTTLLDVLEIIFTNNNYAPEGIAAMYAFIPFVDNPMEIHAKEHCGKTLRELKFSNGVTFRIIYVGDVE